MVKIRHPLLQLAILCLGVTFISTEATFPPGTKVDKSTQTDEEDFPLSHYENIIMKRSVDLSEESLADIHELMEDSMGKRATDEGEAEMDEDLDSMEKRSMAIGRPSLRPGKRSIAMGRLAFRPGKRSMAVGRLSFRPGKRSVAVGRVGFRPGKRSLSLGRVNFRPGKRSVAMGRLAFRPGKRSVAMGRLAFRPGKRALVFEDYQDYCKPFKLWVYSIFSEIVMKYASEEPKSDL